MFLKYLGEGSHSDSREPAIPKEDALTAVEDDDAVLNKMLGAHVHELHAEGIAGRVLRKQVHSRGVLGGRVGVDMTEGARGATEEILDAVAEVVDKRL